jgi:hypothetical protein
MESIKNIAMARRTYWLRFFLLAVILGAVVGFFLLYPINEFVFYFEHHPDSPTVWRFIYGQLIHSLKGFTPDKTSFYAGIGALLGLVVAMFFKSWQKKLKHIEKLHSELEENLGALISQGEGPKLEFKSSFRWDMTQNKVNRALEAVATGEDVQARLTYFEAAMLIALIGFVSTVAVAKYITRGDIIE